jgi:hypothetical protein
LSGSYTSHSSTEDRNLGFGACIAGLEGYRGCQLQAREGEERKEEKHNEQLKARLEENNTN